MLVQKPPPQPKRDDRGDWAKALREAAPYLGMGSSMAVTLLVSVGAGYWLDNKLETRPVFILTGSAFGLFAAGYHFWKIVTIRKP